MRPEAYSLPYLVLTLLNPDSFPHAWELLPTRNTFAKKEGKLSPRECPELLTSSLPRSHLHGSFFVVQEAVNAGFLNKKRGAGGHKLTNPLLQLADSPLSPSSLPHLSYAKSHLNITNHGSLQERCKPPAVCHRPEKLPGNAMPSTSPCAKASRPTRHPFLISASAVLTRVGMYPRLTLTK